MKSLLNRLAEPSTYAGLAGLAVILGIEVDAFQSVANSIAFQSVANSIAGVFGFVAIIIGESGD